MNSKYDDWEANSIRHIAALKSALNGHGGNDLMVPHQEVAYAFPSRDPSIATIDYPLIDHANLIEWCNQRAWVAPLEQESKADGDPHPPVRFRKVE